LEELQDSSLSKDTMLQCPWYLVDKWRTTLRQM
jgi:hypothetical protein